MSNMDYAEMFDLKPEECKLRILICALNDSQLHIPLVEFVDPHLLPNLPFADQSYDLALCPNFLFVANQSKTENFHQGVLKELARVASEVRILPIVDEFGRPANYLGSLLQSLQEEGIGVELRQIYLKNHQQKNAMLRLWNTACVVK